MIMEKYEGLTLNLIDLERETVITGSMTDFNNDGVYDVETKEPEILG